MSDSPNVFQGNFAAAETGVFWDIEDCKITDGHNASELVDKIKSNLSSVGHRGVVSIRVYGDLKDHEFPLGITLNQFPAGERFARQTKILEDIVAWAAEQPQPSTLMLIIGDTTHEFVEVVKLLKTGKKFQFLLAEP